MNERNTTTSVIDLCSLVKEYPAGLLPGRTFRALDRVSFGVRRGEVFGFLGPNGAGKTTTLKIILGFLRATAGEAFLLGRPARDVAAREVVGYLPETAVYPEYLTAREAVSYYARLGGLRGARVRARTDAVLDLAGLGDDADRPLKFHSKGMRQRVGLAQAMVHEPQCLILDEPASGLDPLGRRQVREIIQRLRGEGMTIFFSSHELSEVEAICDTVAVLHRGRLRALGPLDELLAGRTGYRTRAEALESFFVDTIHQAV
ncbi:ABC transporter ATP-binding protein [bacterium]|nr:ABC transporter ATP-binding protein [bacterium]